MIHEKALWYSADRSVTIGQLKEADLRQCPALEKVQHYCDKNNICTMVADQSGFHYKFQLMKQSPYIVYMIGDVSLLDRPTLAIVGPRKPSEYGKKIVGLLIDKLISYDVVTISGLADGIDMMCHQGSTDLGIPTIAILGGGIHHFLQSDKRYIIETIVQKGGLVISEYKLDAKPTYYTFPQRNRIIAGLATAIIIPEAGEKSGSLITADCGFAQKKPVYGVMNSIFDIHSIGLLKYIALGIAKPVYDLDIMLQNHFTMSRLQHDHASHVKNTLDPIQHEVYQFIAEHHECDLQNLLNHTTYTMDSIQTALSYLEISDLIFQSKPGLYSLNI